MWIFSRYGFYSIACGDNADGSPDSQTVMIRARVAAHLRNLQDRFPDLAGAEILDWPHRDYRHRIVVPKAAWVRVVTQMAEEQVWSNFKKEVARYQGRDGSAYVQALYEVWNVMFAVQRGGGSQ